MLWQEQSWPTLTQVDKDLPVVIPLGACEQHGPHLPVFVDSIQVSEIARRIEQRLSDQILLAPTLWLGCSHHHKDFAGTLTLPPSLYIQVIQEVVRSVLRAVFRRILLLNGHGGNTTPGTAALSELVAMDDAADDAYLALATWWQIAGEVIRPEMVGVTQPVVAHAGAYETSLIMALRPDLVDTEKIKARSPVLKDKWFNSDDDAGKRLAVFRRFHRFTADGPMGKPEEASVDSGNKILEAVTAEITQFLQDYARWPQLPVLSQPK